MNTKTETQESGQHEMTGDAVDTVEAVADQTSSPDVTEGTSTSEVADKAEEVSAAEKIRDEFLKEYGADDDEAADGVDAPDDDGEPKADPKKAEDDDDEQAKSERDKAPVENDDGDDEFRLSDEQFNKLEDGVKKRIGHLNARAKRAERVNQEQTERLQVTEESHQRFSTLTKYVEENDIPPESVTTAFETMRLVAQGDAAGVMKLLQPTIDWARQSTGDVLPEDLQKRVDDGYLSQEDAKEIVVSREAVKRANAQAERSSKADAERQSQQSVDDNNQSILSAIKAREAEITSTDPDYVRKAPAVKKQMQALLKLRVPETVEQAIDMVNSAYELASDSYVPQSKPREQERRAPTSRPAATSQSRGQAQATSVKDAITASMESYVPASR